jgi:hypothetical protein
MLPLSIHLFSHWPISLKSRKITSAFRERYENKKNSLPLTAAGFSAQLCLHQLLGCRQAGIHHSLKLQFNFYFAYGCMQAVLRGLIRIWKPNLEEDLNSGSGSNSSSSSGSLFITRVLWRTAFSY